MFEWIYGSCAWPQNVSKSKFNKYQNILEFNNNFQRLFNMAINVFEWKNLPETCSSRFLEHALLSRGQAILVYTDKRGYLTLGAAPGGLINLYGEPVKAWGYGLNGDIEVNREYTLYIEGSELSPELLRSAGLPAVSEQYEGVYCRDNDINYPYINYIVTAAQRMADSTRASDVVLQNLKQPIIITCQDSMMNSVRQALNNKDSNMNAIVSTGATGVSPEDFRVWPTQANPEVLKTMWENYDRIENQTYELFGIDSAAENDKKERLLVDEVTADENIVYSNLDVRYRQRKIFCERANKAFGLNIDVQVRQNPDKVESEKELEMEADQDVESEGLQSTEGV
jgi:hypothetical protein